MRYRKSPRKGAQVDTDQMHEDNVPIPAPPAPEPEARTTRARARTTHHGAVSQGFDLLNTPVTTKPSSRTAAKAL